MQLTLEQICRGTPFLTRRLFLLRVRRPRASRSRRWQLEGLFSARFKCESLELHWKQKMRWVLMGVDIASTANCVLTASGSSSFCFLSCLIIFWFALVLRLSTI